MHVHKETHTHIHTHTHTHKQMHTHFLSPCLLCYDRNLTHKSSGDLKSLSTPSAMEAALVKIMTLESPMSLSFEDGPKPAAKASLARISEDEALP